MSALKQKKTTLLLSEDVIKKIKILSTLQNESMVSFINTAIEERIERMTSPKQKEALLKLLSFANKQDSIVEEDALIDSSVDEVRKHRSSEK